jgi:hypothetical protein
VLVISAHACVKVPVGDGRKRWPGAAFWELASATPEVDEGIVFVLGARLGT